MARVFLLAALLLGTAAAAAADHSLSVADYVAKGMPALDKAWDGRDYEKAAEVLDALDNDQLPHAASPRSGPVMARLTDPANLATCGNRATPLLQRVDPCGHLANGAVWVARLYYLSAKRDSAYADDFLDTVGFLVESTAAEADEMGEFAQRNVGASADAQRTAVLGDARAHLVRETGAILRILADRQSASDAARVRFAKTLVANFPAIAAQLPPDSAEDFRRKLHDMAETDKSPDVRAALSGFY